MNSRRFHCLRPRRFSLARLEQGNASGGTGINGSACAAAIWTRGSRLRVNAGHPAMSDQRPNYPRKRTSAPNHGMSHECASKRLMHRSKWTFVFNHGIMAGEL